MTTSERVYRRLLRLYPRTFRAAYEDEMARLFLDQLRDAGASGRRGALAGHWLRSLADIVMSAPAAYLQPEDATVAKAVDPGTVQLSVASQSNGPVRLGYALASIPFALLVSAFLARPDFMEPIFLNPPAVVGWPAGMVLLFPVAVWASLAFVGIRVTRSAVGIVLSLLFLSFPATIAILMLPPLILIVSNLRF